MSNNYSSIYFSYVEPKRSAGRDLLKRGIAAMAGGRAPKERQKKY